MSLGSSLTRRFSRALSRNPQLLQDRRFLSRDPPHFPGVRLAAGPLQQLQGLVRRSYSDTPDSMSGSGNRLLQRRFGDLSGASHVVGPSNAAWREASFTIADGRRDQTLRSIGCGWVRRTPLPRVRRAQPTRYRGQRVSRRSAQWSARRTYCGFEFHPPLSSLPKRSIAAQPCRERPYRAQPNNSIIGFPVVSVREMPLASCGLLMGMSSAW